MNEVEEFQRTQTNYVFFYKVKWDRTLNALAMLPIEQELIRTPDIMRWSLTSLPLCVCLCVIQWNSMCGVWKRIFQISKRSA